LSHGSLRDHLNRSHKRKREEFVTYEYIRLTYYRLILRSIGDPDPQDTLVRDPDPDPSLFP
jgi:hypothetical protein